MNRGAAAGRPTPRLPDEIVVMLMAQRIDHEDQHVERHESDEKTISQPPERGRAPAFVESKAERVRERNQ